MANSTLANPFNRVSAEIRDIIYTYVLTPEYDLQTRHRGRLALVSALRPIPKFYEEALAVFYKVNVFILNYRTFSDFNNLNLKSIGSIRQLVIVLNDDCYSLWDFMQLFTYSGSKLAHATGIEVLQINVEAGNPIFFSLFETLIHRRCSNLRELYLYIRRRSHSLDRGPNSTGFVEHKIRMIELVERLLDKKPSKSTDPELDRELDAFWLAEKGCSLISGGKYLAEGSVLRGSGTS